MMLACAGVADLMVSALAVEAVRLYGLLEVLKSLSAAEEA